MQSTMKSVVLTRKLSNYIDGIDLTSSSVGDVLEMSFRSASLLIAEGWAEQAIWDWTPTPYLDRRSV
jgi:hypothetical protein